MRLLAALLASAAAVRAQSGSLCANGASPPLQCLSWSNADGNITFTATYNGFAGANVTWGAWGISEIFCGNMFPAETWITYVVSK